MVKITERPADHALAILRRRVQSSLNPFFSFSEAEPSLAAVDSVRAPAGDEWAAAFMELGRAQAAAAEGHVTAGRDGEALKAWRLAYDYGHIARYPHADTEAKREAHALATASFLRAAEYVEAIEPVAIECPVGRISGIFVRPEREGQVPVIVNVGGLDVWKEEVASVVAVPYLAAGYAVLALDSPGTGDSPYAMSLEADEMWDPIFDWTEGRDDLLPGRCVLGTSLGGYWANRVAHTHPQRVRAVINHGGPAHYTFQPEWLDNWVERGEYPVSFSAALQTVTRTEDARTLSERLDELSLLDGGLLEKDSAPLLLVNGRYDRTIDPADMDLLLRVGKPKSARYFEAGHMGFTPETIPTMIDWLARTP
jgi:pimeloyl-ACP methyl ester carboxylesterase